MKYYKLPRSTIDRFSDGKDLIIKNILADRAVTINSDQVPYYGKVNYNFNPVQPREEFLRPITAISGGRIVSAIDFVSDAFAGLRNHLKKAAFYDKIHRNSVFRDLSPTGGYISLDTAYRNYLINIFDGFMGGYMFKEARRDKVKSLNDFINIFVEYANLISDEYPLTKSGYYLMLNQSYLHTGLALRVGDLTQAQVINDPGYNFFAKAVRKFGFMIDRNNSNIIVANIKSEGTTIQAPTVEQPQFGDRIIFNGMLRYLEENGLASEDLFKERFFSMIYNQDHYAVSDFNLLKTYILQFYDNFRFSYPSISARKICFKSGNPKTTPYRIYREGFNSPPSGDFPDDFKTKYPNLFWLSFYYNLKLVEMRRPVASDEEYKRMYKKAVVLYRSRGLGPALGYIHSVTKTVPKMTSYMRSVIANERRRAGARGVTSLVSGPTGGSTGGGMGGY